MSPATLLFGIKPAYANTHQPVRELGAQTGDRRVEQMFVCIVLWTFSLDAVQRFCLKGSRRRFCNADAGRTTATLLRVLI